MPVFVYSGKGPEGAAVKGEIEAVNRGMATAMLRRQRIQIASIKTKPKALSIKIPGFGGKVTSKDIVVFTRQFSTMIESGLTLVAALDILASQTENKVFADAIQKIKKDVEGGDTYADALRKHPKIFDNLYVNMVEAGEIGGILDTVLSRLAGYLEKAASLQQKVKSALVYPASIVSVAVIVVVFLMIFVIPTFGEMFSQAGQKLPLPTFIVLEASRMTLNYGYFLIPPLILGFLGFRKYYATEQGRFTIDKLVLKAPVFGLLIQKISVARFSRTLGTLISSGVPIIDALRITARTSGNKVVERSILSTITSIKEGSTISAPLSEQKVFPPMVIRMIQVGEQSGALDAMLSKIADFYDEEVDATVGALTELLEPMLMVFLGVVVGFIVIAMYMPIFNMASTLGS